MDYKTSFSCKMCFIPQRRAKVGGSLDVNIFNKKKFNVEIHCMPFSSEQSFESLDQRNARLSQHDPDFLTS